MGTERANPGQMVLTQEQWRELSTYMRNSKGNPAWILQQASARSGSNKPECVAITTVNDEPATLISFLIYLIEVTRHPQDSVPTALEDMLNVADRIEVHRPEGSSHPTYFLHGVTMERSQP